MPKDDEFEELLILAAEAIEEKTEDEWDYVPSKDYETFQMNVAGAKVVS